MVTPRKRKKQTSVRGTVSDSATAGTTGLAPMSAFIMGLLKTTSDGLAMFAMARTLACKPFEPGPVEVALREILAGLSRNRVESELGGKTIDALLKEIVPLLDRLPRPELSKRVRFEATPLSAWNLDGPSPVFAMVAPTLPPIPNPLPPEAGGIIDEIMALIRELLERGILQGDIAAEIRALLAQLEELIAAGARSEAIVGQLAKLLRALVAALFRLIQVESGGTAEAILTALMRMMGRLGPLLGRTLVFLGPLMWILFAAQVGYASGSELAKIQVNDKETLGQWWGNRLWDLLKGPCPDLLDALNQAILRWRGLQSIGASEQEQAEALARVLVLESEYIRRCLTPGTIERSNEEQYLVGLEKEYGRLQGKIHGTRATPGRACHVVVTLNRVTYDGDDIGEDWAYQVIVQGSATDFPTHSFRQNEAETPNRVVFDQETGPCPGTVPLTITVQATSVGLIYSTTGITPRLVSFNCPNQSVESLVVRVRDGNTVADLTFNFTIKGSCVDIIGGGPQPVVP